MKTLLFAPEVFLADGGIARILRAYLHALRELSPFDSNDRVGMVVLNDTPASLDRMPTYLRDDDPAPLATASGSRWRFLFACLRHGWTADRVVCGHIHLAPVARLIQLLRGGRRLRYYLVAHGIEVWRPYSAVEKSALRHADRIFCVSEHPRRQMIRFLPDLDPARLVVVPNTLDPDFTLPSAPPARSVSDDLRILMVSRLARADDYKGIDSMIAAMLQIRAQLPRATLRIVGRGDDRERLQTLANASGVSDAIEFLGRVSDEQLRSEYEQCDLFSLPSSKEGFGLVYLEAMSFGKPCLGARAGGAPEVIDENTGLLVDYGNIDEIADACIRIAHRHYDPATVRAHLQKFSFPSFMNHLTTALAD